MRITPAQRVLTTGLTTVIAAFGLSACESNAGADDGALTVSATAEDCAVSADTTASGTTAFEVTNDGDIVTEFYVLGSDGLRIVGEQENIAPGPRRH